MRPRGWPAGQIRTTIWSGMLLGLLAYQATRLAPLPDYADPAVPAIEASDPYSEARRSRAILERQEGSPTRPAPVVDGEASGASAAGRVIDGQSTGYQSVRVIDGDTFDYQGARIRVADIDTPEVHGRCAYEIELAARATQRMHALLAAGPFELRPLSSGRDEDRYGRKLRIVTRGGHSLGDTLVAEGLARTWTGRREPWCV